MKLKFYAYWSTSGHVTFDSIHSSQRALYFQNHSLSIYNNVICVFMWVYYKYIFSYLYLYLCTNDQKLNWSLEINTGLNVNEDFVQK